MSLRVTTSIAAELVNLPHKFINGVTLYAGKRDTEGDREEPYVHRSECFLRLSMPKRALRDADEAIKVMKANVKVLKGRPVSRFEQCRLINIRTKALYCKAEALYMTTDFELSLAYFHRCIRQRSDLAHKFEPGLSKARKAILNTLQDDCFNVANLGSIIDGNRDRSSNIGDAARKVKLANRIKKQQEMMQQKCNLLPALKQEQEEKVKSMKRRNRGKFGKRHIPPRVGVAR